MGNGDVAPECDLAWHGPLAWLPAERDSLFTSPLGYERGVYLFTAPVSDGFAIYAAGVTSRNFRQRLREHTTEYLAGTYNVLDASELVHGRRKVLWEGLWYGRDSHTRLGELLARRGGHFAEVESQLRCLRIFVAPLTQDNRILKRLEAAIMNALYAPGNPFCLLPDRGMRLEPRRSDEQPIRARFSCSATLHGLPATLEL